MIKSKHKVELRHRRHRRVRKKVEGTPERPRLSVFRSGKHIYAQIIDDWSQTTLISVSSLTPELKGELKHGAGVAGATKVGELLGKRCIEKGISAVVFDRAGYRYHGRVKALAEAARAQFALAGARGF
jgi:large subunit ribosomal protein L18